MERKDYLYNVDEKEHFYKIDLSLFIISLLIVLSKAVIGYWSSLPSIFNSSYDVSDNFLSSIFSSIIELWIPVEWIIKPILIGLMMSFITWQIIYLDSDLPGVRPSTPFTYNKYYKRSKSNCRYHLCYIFAMAVAPLTTVSLLITDYLQ